MRLIDKLLVEKQAKEQRKITQLKAAEEAGVDSRLFYHILTGLTAGSRSSEAIKKIAKYFGLSVKGLMDMVENERLS